jgi:hypothetical protein
MARLPDCAAASLTIPRANSRFSSRRTWLTEGDQ